MLTLVLAFGATPSQAEALAGGSITGQLTDNGQPVPYASVSLYTSGFTYAGFASTDANGRYTFAVANPGDYKVAFSLPGFVKQWAHQKASFDAADVITVGSSEVVVDETVAPHGSMSGHVSLSDGSPAAFAWVALRSTNLGSSSPQTSTDANGNYSMPNVPPGTYTLSFRPNNGPESWAPGKQTSAEAQVFAVAVGQTLTVDDQLPATGRVVGHITDGGQPVAGAYISGNGQDGGYFSVTSGQDGSFAASTYAGSYQVQFQLPNGLYQYAHGKVDSADADPVVVIAGADTALEEQVAPTGNLAGHVYNLDGSPASNVSVNAYGRFGDRSTNTDANGSYQLRAYPGAYALSFSNGTQRIWAPGTGDAAQRSLTTVTAGQTATVDQTLLANGSLTVTVRDAKTNEPVNSFCAYADSVQQGQCTENGTATFDAVGPGLRNVNIYASDEKYAVSQVNAVTVVSGQHASLAVAVKPYGHIKTVVRDAATGQPVEGACLDVITDGDINSIGRGSPACSDAAGNVDLMVNGAGIYKVLVWAGDQGGYGHQWVGLNGGVGTPVRARPVIVKLGETTTIPPVTLDKAGVISGLVTDRSTGAPITSAVVGIATVDTGFGGGRGMTGTDATGHYTLPGFGPYEWPILAVGYHYGAMWSGNTGNRLLSTGVAVSAGQNTTYNVSLSATPTITGVVTGPNGPMSAMRIVAINAITGDAMGTADTNRDGTYTLPVFGAQVVKLMYTGYEYGTSYEGWYGNSADREHATPVIVPASGSKTVNITSPRLAPVR